jgi:hypothetical protein
MANPTPDTTQMTSSGVQPRDDNDSAISGFGLRVANSITLSASNTTANVPVFHITGTVNVLGLWGVVTTVIGANHTGGLFRLNDQTAQVAITATGVTLSGLAAGTVIAKKGLAAAAATLLDNAAGRVSEPTTLETTVMSPFLAVKKTGATTDIEYQYATTDTPTSGVIQFFCQYLPVSLDGKVTPV